MRSRRWLLGASVLCLAAPLLRQAVHAERPDPTPPAAPAAPPPTREPCEIIAARIIASLGTPDDALSNGERDRLHQDARELGRDGQGEVNRACRTSVLDALVARPSCARAEAAVAGGLMVAAVETPEDARRLVSEARPACAATFAESAGFAAHVDLGVARALVELASSNEGARRSAWLAYGSIGEIAGRAGVEEVRAEVDETLRSRLARSTKDDRLLFVESAGNAGCRSCASMLLRDASSKDVSLRRSAVAALRFLEEPRAVRRACAALDSDPEVSIRDLAAWSLAFREHHDAIRVPCLYRAALEDPSPRVRVTATRALAELSDSLETAYAALVQLTEPEAPTRALAAQLLATDPDHGARPVNEDSLASFFAAATASAVSEPSL